MMTYMKCGRTALRVLAALLAALSLGTPASAHTENTPYNWYFLKNEKHEQPGLDAGMKFIEDYDCVYVSPDKASKTIYLTFDAGYENGNIAKVLDALKAHGAHGAFFILDNLVKRNKDLVCRMANEGHLVCNHTARHPDMAAITDKAAFCRQLTDLEKVYTEATGRELSRFYRPPRGRFSEQNLKYAEELGYTTVFWSYAYADWDNDAQPDPETSIRQILLHTHPGMVILLHPTSSTNAGIIDRLLTLWEQSGWRFGSLEELKK